MLNKDLSKERLGGVGMIPIVPMMPVAAQVSAQTGMLHIKLLGDSYVRAGLPTFHPGAYKATVEAIKACPTAPSWSGSGTPYYVLTVEPQPDGQSAILKAGAVVIGRIAVYPEAEIISVDVPIDQQIEEGGGKPGPQGPGVN